MTARIREATTEDAPALARVHVASWRATYRGIVPDAYLHALSEERRAEGWRQALLGGEPDLFVYVAEDGAGAILGFASGSPERSGDPLYRGELQAIYLMPGSQRRGLGRALAATVARRLATRELRSMLLWVLVRTTRRAASTRRLAANQCASKPLISAAPPLRGSPTAGATRRCSSNTGAP